MSLSEYEDNQYYVVEKILDEKTQEGKKYYLVKWQGWDVKTSTWQEQKNISHLHSLIKDFQKARRFDLQNNRGVKSSQKIAIGESPYDCTGKHGHFLYGDIPKRILQVQTIQKFDSRIVLVEIEWEQQIGRLVGNSIIDSKVVMQHAPQFLSRFYEERVRLVCDK